LAASPAPPLMAFLLLLVIMIMIFPATARSQRIMSTIMIMSRS
jgi:hypothetical protein